MTAADHRPTLDPAFLTIPLAHRGLHDRAAGVIENSRAAITAAVEAGYGVEIDLQLSADGEAMVFHDDELLRLTPVRGPVRTGDHPSRARTSSRRRSPSSGWSSAATAWGTDAARRLGSQRTICGIATRAAIVSASAIKKGVTP